ncbi:hypothetical protein B0H17DRAFT_1192098 [Mycena rosella]|uniref:Uncharacterized protein n=1 Tax=Mycena rosella TaxID=1033263 RepID=A0AAD7GXR8_MYCRO|nr:hypothetical protein B0H17DRAFT_1192098 [Mycena rosella]
MLEMDDDGQKIRNLMAANLLEIIAGRLRQLETDPTDVRGSEADTICSLKAVSDRKTQIRVPLERRKLRTISRTALY